MSVHKWLFLVSVWRRDPMHDSIQIFAQLKLEQYRFVDIQLIREG